MKLSKNMHAKLYRSIYNPIIELRVKIAMGDVKNLDEELFALENRIYKDMKETLNLHKVEEFDREHMCKFTPDPKMKECIDLLNDGREDLVSVLRRDGYFDGCLVSQARRHIENCGS